MFGSKKPKDAYLVPRGILEQKTEYEYGLTTYLIPEEHTIGSRTDTVTHREGLGKTHSWTANRGAGISGVHLRIDRVGEAYMLTDTSRHGTFINGKRMMPGSREGIQDLVAQNYDYELLPTPVELKEGDRIGLGTRRDEAELIFTFTPRRYDKEFIWEQIFQGIDAAICYIPGKIVAACSKVATSFKPKIILSK